MEVVNYTLPAHWASALINADRSGLEPDDEKELEGFLGKMRQEYDFFDVTCPKDDQEPYFSYRNDAGTLACNVLDFPCMVTEKAK